MRTLFLLAVVGCACSSGTTPTAVPTATPEPIVLKPLPPTPRQLSPANGALVAGARTTVPPFSVTLEWEAVGDPMVAGYEVVLGAGRFDRCPFSNPDLCLAYEDCHYSSIGDSQYGSCLGVIQGTSCTTNGFLSRYDESVVVGGQWSVRAVTEDGRVGDWSRRWVFNFYSAPPWGCQAGSD